MITFNCQPDKNTQFVFFMRCDTCKETWNRGIYCPSCGAPIQKSHSRLMENLLWVAAALGVLGTMALMGMI
jgi:rRNA maturation endonuclease Nob1